MKLVKRDIKGIDLFTYYRDKYGNSLLINSIVNGDYDSFDFLIKKNKLINQKNECGESPLHLCAEFNRYDMALSLIEEGAFMEYKNLLGWTPLFQSILSNSYETFKILLNARSDTVYDQGLDKKIKLRHYFNPYIKDIYGYTVVHHAYVKKDKRYLEDIVKKLKEYKMFYIENEVKTWQDTSFIKLYNSESFKEEQYLLNKDAFSYDLNR